MNKKAPNNIKILVCCHKESSIPQNDFFLPIHVGASLTDKHWGIQRDDEVQNHTCDNISNKNKSYCELTALYWAWKNIRTLHPEIKYIGLNHYRRYFIGETHLFDKEITTTGKIPDYKLPKTLTTKYHHYDLILSKKVTLSTSVAKTYNNNHFSKDYRLLKTIIKEDYPDFYRDFLTVMEYGNTFSPYNMFVMKYDIFEEYCKFIFDVLANVENKIDISFYDDVQKRVFGYLAERLSNVFYAHLARTRKLKIKYLPIVFYDDNSKLNPISCILDFIKCKCSFFFQRPLFFRKKHFLV